MKSGGSMRTERNTMVFQTVRLAVLIDTKYFVLYYRSLHY